MQSILAGQGNRSPGGKSVRQERALGKIVKPAVKLESTPPRASPLSPSLRRSLLFLVPRSVEAPKKRPRFCVHAVMVMRGLRCVLAGCVSGPRNGNETVSHHHHQHPTTKHDANDQRLLRVPSRGLKGADRDPLHGYF